MTTILQEEMVLREQGISSSQPTHRACQDLEWEAAADVTEMLSKPSMNSLRMCGRKGPCQESEAGKLGHRHYTNSPTPTWKLFTLIPGPWSSNKDIRWFSVAQTISNKISVHKGFIYRAFL